MHGQAEARSERSGPQDTRVWPMDNACCMRLTVAIFPPIHLQTHALISATNNDADLRLLDIMVKGMTQHLRVLSLAAAVDEKLLQVQMRRSKVTKSGSNGFSAD
jgi:hypothetical protein